MADKSPVTSFCMRFIEENQKAIVILLLLMSVIGGVVGLRYYKHTREDPEFCVSCHMMKEAFRSWQMSKHRDFTCQVCHTMSIMEQNRMLIAYVIKGAVQSNSSMAVFLPGPPAGVVIFQRQSRVRSPSTSPMVMPSMSSCRR